MLIFFYSPLNQIGFNYTETSTAAFAQNKNDKPFDTQSSALKSNENDSINGFCYYNTIYIYIFTGSAKCLFLENA